MKKVFALLFSLLASAAHAESKGGAWVMFFPDVKLSDSWNVASDFQLRQSAALDRNRQTLSRSVVNYAVSPEIKLGIGYAYVNVTDYDPSLETPNSENRIFQQFEYKKSIGAVAIGHRVRNEQRFIHQNGDSTLQHRLRYRVSARHPKPSEPGLYASANNEIFIDYARGTWATYAQNRFYSALGAPLDELQKLRAEVGYMWQAIRREHRDSHHVHALQLSLHWDL